MIACHYSCQHGRFGNQKAYSKPTYMWSKWLSRGIEARKISESHSIGAAFLYVAQRIVTITSWTALLDLHKNDSVTSRFLLVRLSSRHWSSEMGRERDERSLHAKISYKMRDYEGRWVECKLNARLSDTSLKRKSTKTARQHMSSSKIITRNNSFRSTFVATLQSEMKSNN